MYQIIIMLPSDTIPYRGMVFFELWEYKGDIFEIPFGEHVNTMQYSLSKI